MSKPSTLPARTIVAVALLVSLAAVVLSLVGGGALLTSLLEQEAVQTMAERAFRWRLDVTYGKLPGLMLQRLLVLIWLIAGAVLLLSRQRVRALIGERGLNLCLSLGVVLLLYCCTEWFAAPFLINRLDLFYFYSVLDVDHRLPANDPEIPTNSDGIRDRREAAAFVPETLNIIVLGDSFTFGQHVPMAAAFPAQLEGLLQEQLRTPHLRVANFGWVSSSPFLSLRLLRDIGARYHPDLVLMCVDMTDLYEEVLYPSMLERRGMYRLYDLMPITLSLLRQLSPDRFWAIYHHLNSFMPASRHFAANQPLAETRPTLELTLGRLRELKAEADQLGAGFVVFVLPRHYQYSDRESPDDPEAKLYERLGPDTLEPFRFFAEARPGLDFPIISLLDDFRSSGVYPTCFRNDPHWNPAGHRIAAEAIANHLIAIASQ